MNQDQSKLSMYVICCHVDKMLQDEIPNSKFDVLIQAGAALTDMRICELNDMIGLEDNISDRNQRYSEMTAMYWIGNNIQSDYIGITHYRRRFLLSDEELEHYMEEGFDILATVFGPSEGAVDDNYCHAYYGYDWKLYMDILAEFAPEDKEFALELYSRPYIHPCNMGIFSAKMYKEYCEWAFPMLDAFYKRSAVKTDTYQRRDVGFIGERMTSLFIEKKKRQGAVVHEVPHKEFRSNNWTPEQECDLSDYDEVYQRCALYFDKNDITKCRRLVAGALNHGGQKDARIQKLTILFKIALEEQKVLPETLFDYLPLQWRSNLETVLATIDGFSTIVTLMYVNQTPEVVTMFDEFITRTGFSDVAIDTICKIKGYE